MAVIEAIATQYLEADTASVTFSSIPATYEHLQLRMSIRSGAAAGFTSPRVQLNSDTDANYAYHRMYGTGSTAAAAATSPNSYIFLNADSNTDDASADFSGMVLNFLDYANTNKNTTVQGQLGTRLSSATPAVYFVSGLWDATAAVSTIKIYEYSLLARGSEFTLYGLNSS